MYVTRVWREHYGLRVAGSSPVYYKHRYPSRLTRWWGSFWRKSFPQKTFSLLKYSMAGVGSYALLCAVVHMMHRRTINAMFLPTEDYILDDWNDVEPTLREGDIILMRGVGLLSWLIATAQFAFGVLHPAALRYSHVAIVVQPAELEPARVVNPGAKGSELTSAWSDLDGSSGAVYVSKTNSNDNHNAVPCDASPTRQCTKRSSEAGHRSEPGSYYSTASSSPTRCRPTRLCIEEAQYPYDVSVHAQHSHATQSSHGAQCTAAASHSDSSRLRRSHTSPPPYAVRDILCAETAALEPSRQRRLRRGAIILEAMDNVDFHVDDIHGEGKYNVVQRVEATKRLCSLDAQGNHAYLHFSVRRLRNFNRTPDMLQRIHQFCEDNEGRPMDGSMLYVLSFIHPRLYALLRPSRFVRREVSCSELVVELYQRLGLVQRMWRWVPLEAQELAAFVHAAECSAPRRRVGGGEACREERPESLVGAKQRMRWTAGMWNRLMNKLHQSSTTKQNDGGGGAVGDDGSTVHDTGSNCGASDFYCHPDNSRNDCNRTIDHEKDDEESALLSGASWNEAAERSVQHAWRGCLQSSAQRAPVSADDVFSAPVPLCGSCREAEILSWPYYPHDGTPPHTRGEMRVRENVYARAERAAAVPLQARELPVVQGYAVIENGERMRDRAVRMRSTTPLYTVCENNEYDVDSTVRVEYAPCCCVGECGNRTSSSKAGRSTNSDCTITNTHSYDDNGDTNHNSMSMTTRSAAVRCDGSRTTPPEGDLVEVVSNTSHHPITLRAGDVAFDTDGRLCQLRWYYKHNSLQTSPYHFTENVDRHAMNWTPGCGLGYEIRMSIPRPDERESRAHSVSCEDTDDCVFLD